MRTRVIVLWVLTIVCGSLGLVVYLWVSSIPPSQLELGALIAWVIMAPLIIGFIIGVIGLIISYSTGTWKKPLAPESPKLHRWKNVVYTALAIGLVVIIIIIYFVANKG